MKPRRCYDDCGDLRQTTWPEVLTLINVQDQDSTLWYYMNCMLRYVDLRPNVMDL